MVEKKKAGTLRALTAAAKKVTANVRAAKNATEASWTAEAWEHYDQVGELHFLVNTIANRVGQAALFVGERPLDNSPGQTPTKVDPAHETAVVLDALGSGPAGLAAMLTRVAQNLQVVGSAYIVGIPPEWEELANGSDSLRVPRAAAGTVREIADLSWEALSLSEVRETRGSYEVDFRGTTYRDVSLDDIILVRLWDPHPRNWRETDSAVRASLPALRKIVGVNKYTSAQLDSALAGAGLLVVPQSVKDGGSEDEPDAFVEDLMEYMLTPLEDRASASSLVPYVIGVPPETDANAIRHITFSTPLDSHSEKTREDAIRSLALSLDAPPELLLGQGQTNHWSAWLIKDDTVQGHIEPLLVMVCEALTTQYLRPVLEEMGYDPVDVAKYSVWYDVSDLVERPNKIDDAVKVFDRGELSGTALREYGGFSETDAPEVVSEESLAVEMAVKLLMSAPDLMTQPGIDPLLEEITGLLGKAPLPNRPGPDAIEKATAGGRGSASSAPSEPEAGGSNNPPKEKV